MIEGIPTSVTLRNIGLFERKRVEIFKSFPKLIGDALRYSELAQSLETRGYGFMRAKLPIKFKVKHYDPEKMNNSSYIMLCVLHEGSKFNLVPIPGIHDVTANRESVGINPHDTPINNFKTILRFGFQGGNFCNTFLRKPSSQFFEGYAGNKVHRYTASEGEETKGDKYRLLLWSGFSGNFSPTPARNKDYSYATVLLTPPSRIEPVILLAPDLSAHQINERVAYYKENITTSAMKKKPKIITRNNDIVATL